MSKQKRKFASTLKKTKKIMRTHYHKLISAIAAYCLICGTLNAQTISVTPAHSTYTADEMLTLTYKDIPIGSTIKIFKDVSLQPMQEMVEVSDSTSGSTPISDSYEPGVYSVRYILDGDTTVCGTFEVVDPEYARGKVSIVLLSDIHVMEPSLIVSDGKAVDDYISGDRKMLRQSAEIFTTMCDSIIKLSPDLVMISGDLTKDGELVSHEYVANELERLRQAGIPSLVIPGNHDCNNPSARSYDGDDASYVATVTRDEFAEIYKNFGYSATFDNWERDENSLSYVCEPVKGLVVLGIDSNRDEENTLVSRGDASNSAKVAGRIKDATLPWLLEKAKNAVDSGKQVIAMMHHHLVPHFDKEATLVYPYILAGADSIKQKFMEAGIRLVITGHFHVPDIAKNYNSDRTDSIIEIANGALVGYPIPFRVLNIMDKTYSQFETHTGYIKSIASMPDLQVQAQATLSRCVPSLVRTLCNMYYSKILARASKMFGGTEALEKMMNIPTASEANDLAQKYLVDAARRSYMLMTEGNENFKETETLRESFWLGVDSVLQACAKPGYIVALRMMCNNAIKTRINPVLTSVYQDINNTGTDYACNINDLYCTFTLPSAYTDVRDITLAERQAVSVEYYDLAGCKHARPVEGVNIVVTTYDDGSRRAKKILR